MYSHLSITRCLYTPFSSHSSSAPGWGPSPGSQLSMNFSIVGLSYRLQFFTNCCSEGLFHRVQYIRSWLLWHGSFRGSPASKPASAQTPLSMGLQGCFSDTLNSSCPSPLAQQFFPHFKSLVTGVLPPSLMGLGSASRGSALELADIGSATRGESFWHLLLEATPAASPGLCFCQANQIHFGQNILPNRIPFK